MRRLTEVIDPRLSKSTIKQTYRFRETSTEKTLVSRKGERVIRQGFDRHENMLELVLLRRLMTSTVAWVKGRRSFDEVTTLIGLQLNWTMAFMIATSSQNSAPGKQLNDNWPYTSKNVCERFANGREGPANPISVIKGKQLPVSKEPAKGSVPSCVISHL